MTEIEAKKIIEGKLACMTKCGVFERENYINGMNCDNCSYCYEQGNFGQQKEALHVAIKALEKQDKIKEAFEKWQANTSGFFGADDETIHLIFTLKKILRSDEE